jgi:DNA-binding cell septation regulator SpoVG
VHKKISEIQIIPIKASDGLIGFTSFVFDDSLYLGGVGIYTRPQGGIRLTYPTRTHSSGSINVFHPINKVVADEIEFAVEEKFKEVVIG